jgi:hypothetical protein
MTTTLEFNSVYWATLGISFSGIIFSLIWVFRNKKSWGYILAPFLFFLNTFLYTTTLRFNFLTHYGNELWEGIIVLHALLLFLLLLFVMPLKFPVNKEGE